MNEPSLQDLYDAISALAEDDVGEIARKNAEYNNSWIKRGGVGAFMMLARKWDRIEEQVRSPERWDIIEHALTDSREEGLLDDIRDLRRYLFLVEGWVRCVVMERDRKHDAASKMGIGDTPVANLRTAPELYGPGPGYVNQDGPVKARVWALNQSVVYRPRAGDYKAGDHISLGLFDSDGYAACIIPTLIVEDPVDSDLVAQFRSGVDYTASLDRSDGKAFTRAWNSAHIVSDNQATAYRVES